MSMLLAPNFNRTLGAYGIKQAALLGGTTADFLSITFANPATSRKTGSLSIWELNPDTSAGGALFASGTTTTSDSDFFSIEYASLKINMTTAVTNVQKTTAVYRDPTAFTHWLMTWDTTLASDQFQLYKNGVQVAVWDVDADVPQNTDLALFHTYAHNLGRRATGTASLDSVIAMVTGVDGQALLPSNFGKLDLSTGNWIAKKYTGTYGTNGFRLDFSNVANLGEDSSGNGNDWTVNGTITQVSSTPTDVSATWDRLAAHTLSINLSNGNKTITSSAGAVWVTGKDTLNARVDDMYVECAYDSVGAGGSVQFGIMPTDVQNVAVSINPSDTANGGACVYADTGGNLGHRYNSVLTDLGTPAAGQVFKMFFKPSTGDLWLGYDTTWFGGGDPDLGTLPTFTGLTDSAGYVVVYALHFSGSSPQLTARFADDEWMLSAPSSAKAITTNNLPKVSNNVYNHWKPVLYSGTNPTPTSVTGVGFQPDLVWIKSRTQTYHHYLYDAVRGVGIKGLYPSSTAIEGEPALEATGITSFDADGFTINEGGCNDPTGAPDNFVAWCANLPTVITSGWAGSPTIVPTQERCNVPFGMSVVQGVYPLAGGVQTFPHSLGVKPGLIILKDLDNVTSWIVYHSSLGPTQYLLFNTTASAYTGTSSTFWADTEPTSELLTMGANIVNPGARFVAYIFAPSDFIKIGSYTGNGNTDGPFLNEGLSPVWSITKKSSSNLAGSNWDIYDSVRDPYNVVNHNLQANTAAVEQTSGFDAFDFTSVGSKGRSAGSFINEAAQTYVYMMIGQPQGPTENTAR